MKYLTDLEALNYHGYDWHSHAFKKGREYPEEVRGWAGDYGVEVRGDTEVASPVRAFLDHLFYTIRFLKTVPTYRTKELLFSEEEEREILKKVKELLEPALNKEERELLKKWIAFNAGGAYEPVHKSLLEREAWKRRFGKGRSTKEDFRRRLGKAFDF
jgi:hypothetical protein